MVSDKFYIDSDLAIHDCSRCAQSNESVLRAVMQCSKIVDIWNYAEQALQCVGRILQIAVSILRIATSPAVDGES